MALDLSTRVDEMIRVDPGAPALNVDDHWRPWSYLSRGVDELDRLLAARGIGSDARIGIVMRNRAETVRALVATVATRRCIVTLSPMMARGSLLEEAGRLGLAALMVGKPDWGDGDLAEIVSRAGGLAVEVLDDPEGGMGDVVGRTTEPAASPDRRKTTAAGVAVQMLTSGTTGPARRVDLTYAALAREFLSTAQPGATNPLAERRLRSGTAVSWAPMVHIGGLRTVLASVIAGRRIAMLEKFDIDPWQRLLTEHRPRVISLVPTALRMVFDAQVPPETFGSVQVVMCGTAPVPPDLVDAFEERYGVAVLTMYGATEFGGVAGWTYEDWSRFRDAKRGSVGRPNPGVSVRVVDPTSGEALRAGEAGLLEVADPAIGGAWVRTTDRARVDRDGFLWILGRVDDVIIRGGFKVSLDAVREALLDHPSVTDAVVIGVPDKRLGDVPVAAVEAPQCDVDGHELVEHASSLLQRYQVPVEIRVLRSLPRTPSMKTDGAVIRSLFRDWT
jgi:acyl-CoA synthetase (AMP-forming)/AMP-acid ligase II